MCSIIWTARSCWSLGVRYQKFIGVLRCVNFSLLREMEENGLLPPGNLHGMKVLDKEAFKKSVNVLSLMIEEGKLRDLTVVLKRYFLKCVNFKPVQETDAKSFKRIFFDPTLVTKMSDFDDSCQNAFQRLNLNEDSFKDVTITLSYDNWSAKAILKAVLPEGETPLTGFSVIGHIIHVNLKNHLLEYKYIIGQILLDKFSSVRTVVNKVNRIESEYRNFDLELIAGVPEYFVRTKENACTYEMDFSAVYWNPRLSTEHARIIDFLGFGDVLFDVFSGIGPFAIPVARKKCRVFANDLNPESFKWLKKNVSLNTTKSVPIGDYIQVFNKDGADFIRDEVKTNMIDIWKNSFFNGKIVVVMNLPALALTFLKHFKGLFKADCLNGDVGAVKEHLPIVICYFFAEFLSSKESIESLIEEQSGISLKDIEDYSIQEVRNVSRIKNMNKIEFKLPFEYLFSKSCDDININDKATDVIEEPKAKRICKSP